MLKCYKDRKLDKGQAVKVYYNLHKHVFSVKDAKTGLVLAHGNNIVIDSPLFQVNQKGRNRVLQELRKNVHAYVVGTYVGVTDLLESQKEQYDRVYYNPYSQDKFTVGHSDEDANSRYYRQVILSDKSVFAL